MNTAETRVGIIGGGVGGLSAAYDLAGQGYSVTVYEGAGEVGGLASGFQVPGWSWALEKFYHHLFTSDYEILDLAREIGIGNKIIFRRPITAMWYQGAAYPFDSPMRLLQFPHLPLQDKLRMGMVIAYLRFSRSWQAFEQTTSHAWLKRWMGSAAYELLWEPMLIGKFGDHYQEVNLAWFWARVYKRSPALGYFEGGFQTFCDALADAVRQRGGKIHLHSRVERVSRLPHGKMEVRVDGVAQEFDAVIATVSPGLLTRLAPDLPSSYLQQLLNLKSMGAVVMTVALDRRLTDRLYWINLPKKEGFPFLAFVEHTNFMPPEHYGGQHLLYLGDYLDPDHRYFHMSAEELQELFLPVLKRFNPRFQESWVQGTWLHRAPYAQPVVPVNYSQHIPAQETPIPGLFFVSMSQVYPWDRGTNYAVELGRRVAALADDWLRNVLRDPWCVIHDAKLLYASRNT